MMISRSSEAEYPAARSAAVIAPADVPAMFCGPYARSSSVARAPASPIPLTPPPSKTRSAWSGVVVMRPPLVEAGRTAGIELALCFGRENHATDDTTCCGATRGRARGISVRREPERDQDRRADDRPDRHPHDG